MRAHRTDGVSFTFGVLFLALSGWWLVGQLLDLALPPVGWFMAGALILLGSLGLLGAVRAARNGSAPNETARTGATPDGSTPAAPTSGGGLPPTSGAGAEPTSGAGPRPTSGAPGYPGSGTWSAEDPVTAPPASGGDRDR